MLWEPKNSEFANWHVPFNVANCLSYIVAASALEQGNMLPNTTSALSNYGIKALNQSTIQEVNNTVSKCLEDFCQFSGCDTNPLFLESVFGGQGFVSAHSIPSLHKSNHRYISFYPTIT